MPNDTVAAPTIEDEMSTFVTESNETEPAKAEDKAAPPAKVAETPAAEVVEEPEVEATPEDDEAEQPPVKKAKPTAQERIAELTRQRHEAQRAAVAEKERSDALEARLAKIEKGGLTEKARPATDDKEPDPTDAEKYPYGELDSKYTKDLARYEVRQELKADKAAQEKQRQDSEAATRLDGLKAQYQTFEKAGVEKYDDFEEVVVRAAESGKWKPSPELGELILGSEVGADVAYHIVTHPEEWADVSGKSPARQAAYFGRLEAKFSSTSSDAPAPRAVKTTQAPPPPASRARGAGSKTGYDPNGNFEDFEAKFGSPTT